MPCDTISQAEIDAGRMDPKLILAALQEMGLHPRHDRANIYDHDAGSYNHLTGQAVWRGWRADNPEEATRQLKQGYSRQIVKTQAARYGWTLRTSKDNPNKFTVVKR